MPTTPPPISSAAPRFKGADDFARLVNPQTGVPGVEQHFPVLVDQLDLSATAQHLDGLGRVSLLRNLQKLVENARRHLLHLGTVETTAKEHIITSYADGKEAVTRFPVANRAIVRGPETPVEEFMTQALGPAPRVIINPVGWTIPNPDVLAENNPVFARKAEQLKAALEGNPDFDKLYKKGMKKMAGQYYEAAFQQFWQPILEYLFDDLKLPVNRFAFLTSASYDGVDKAAMDFGEARDIDVVNITPFTYAEWMDTGKSYPLLVTNDVDDYAEACAKAANFLFVTGGRAHAWQKDVKNFMIEENKAVIPVDIMREIHGFEIPTVQGLAVENAARMLIDRGLDISKAGFAQNVRNKESLTETQKQVAGALVTLYNQLTTADPKAIAEGLA